MLLNHLYWLLRTGEVSVWAGLRSSSFHWISRTVNNQICSYKGTSSVGWLSFFSKVGLKRNRLFVGVVMSRTIKPKDVDGCTMYIDHLQIWWQVLYIWLSHTVQQSYLHAFRCKQANNKTGSRRLLPHKVIPNFPTHRQNEAKLQHQRSFTKPLVWPGHDLETFNTKSSIITAPWLQPNQFLKSVLISVHLQELSSSAMVIPSRTPSRLAMRKPYHQRQTQPLQSATEVTQSRIHSRLETQDCKQVRQDSQTSSHMSLVEQPLLLMDQLCRTR